MTEVLDGLGTNGSEVDILPIGGFLNVIGDEGPERFRAAFGPSYARLAEIRTPWDPDNAGVRTPRAYGGT